MIKIKLRKPHREYLKVNEENFEEFIERIVIKRKSYIFLIIGIKLKESWRNIKDEFRGRAFSMLPEYTCFFSERRIYKFHQDFSLSELKRQKSKYFKKLFSRMKADLICLGLISNSITFMPGALSLIISAIDKFIELYGEIEIELLCLNRFNMREIFSLNLPQIFR